MVDAEEYRRLVSRASAASAASTRAQSLQALQLKFDAHLAAVTEGHDDAFETTLGATTIPPLLREACDQHTVAVWFCGLSTAQLHLERVEARVAAGGHAIREHKIHERYEASRANLITLLPHLAVLHVYDNSAPADAAGQAEPLLVLELDRAGLHYPATLEALAQVPDWAKPIVMAALETRSAS